MSRATLVLLLVAALAAVGVAVALALAAAPAEDAASASPPHGMADDARCRHMPQHCEGGASDG